MLGCSEPFACPFASPLLISGGSSAGFPAGRVAMVRTRKPLMVAASASRLIQVERPSPGWDDVMPQTKP